MTEINEPKTFREIVLHNKKLEHDHKDKFKEIFSIDLHPLMNFIFGFDIVEFHKWLQTPNDLSIKDYVIKKYGLEAANLIKKLIS